MKQSPNPTCKMKYNLHFLLTSSGGCAFLLLRPNGSLGNIFWPSRISFPFGLAGVDGRRRHVLLIGRSFDSSSGTLMESIFSLLVFLSVHSLRHFLLCPMSTSWIEESAIQTRHNERLVRSAVPRLNVFQSHRHIN